jgi:LysM repeat protein
MLRPGDGRRRVGHYAAPILLLALVTVAVLLIRSGLETRSPKTATTPAATQASTRTTVRHRRHAKPRTAASYYTVQTGDTYGSISAKTGVTVSQLERLNPGVSSNALQVGQKLRVK